MPPSKNNTAAPSPVKNTKGKNAPVVQPPADDKPARVKLSDLPPAEREAKAHELIDQLYGLDTTEESQAEKRRVRARLRNLDKEWLTTYAAYIEENYPSATEEEETPAPAPAPAKGKGAKK